MSKLIVVVSLVAVLAGCASTAGGGGGPQAQTIEVPMGDFPLITIDAPMTKEVECTDCAKKFPVRLVRGEVKDDNPNDQDIVVPGGESFGGTLESTVLCPYCKKPVKVRVHSHK